MRASLSALIPRLRRFATAVAADSDAVLLDRFVAQSDEQASASLMRRHGPIVLGVACRVLGDRHAAEDVFQATFLVLARQAATVRQREALAGWLYRVAHRLALAARSKLPAARRLGDRDWPDARPGPLADLTTREALQIFDA